MGVAKSSPQNQLLLHSLEYLLQGDARLEYEGCLLLLSLQKQPLSCLLLCLQSLWA